MKIHIKNMVCLRCVLVVEAQLKRLDLKYSNVRIGEVDFSENISKSKLDQLDKELQKTGLKLIEDKKSILVEDIRNAIIDLVHDSVQPIHVNLSEYLSDRLKHDYTYLANLFSSVKGITIEHFYLTQRIEKVKELMIYDQLSLTEIAYRLHYSSVAHLSNQFKKMTGMAPSQFRKLKSEGKDYC